MLYFKISVKDLIRYLLSTLIPYLYIQKKMRCFWDYKMCTTLLHNGAFCAIPENVYITLPSAPPSLPPPQYPTEGFLVSTLPILWKFQLSCTLSTGILGLTSDDSQLEREMSRQTDKIQRLLKDQSTWFGHLQKNFCYEEVQFKLFCLPVKTNCPPAENVNKSPEKIVPRVKHENYLTCTFMTVFLISIHWCN